MREKWIEIILTSGCNINKCEKSKGVWILSECTACKTHFRQPAVIFMVVTWMCALAFCRRVFGLRPLAFICAKIGYRCLRLNGFGISTGEFFSFSVFYLLFVVIPRSAGIWDPSHSATFTKFGSCKTEECFPSFRKLRRIFHFLWARIRVWDALSLFWWLFPPCGVLAWCAVLNLGSRFWFTYLFLASFVPPSDCVSEGLPFDFLACFSEVAHLSLLRTLRPLFVVALCWWLCLGASLTL